MQTLERFVEIKGEVLIEILVILILQLGSGAAPDNGGCVDLLGLIIEIDRIGNIVAVFADDLADLEIIGVFFRVGL